MASTEMKAEMILQRTRQEMSEELFVQFFDSILEQSQMTPAQEAILRSYTDPQDKTPEILAKRDSFVDFLNFWKSRAEFLREREKQIAEERHSIEKFVGHVEGGILVQLLNWGCKKVEGAVHRFTVKKNPPRVEIYDESLLPTEYVKYAPSADKTSIRAALDAGKEVPGARYAETSSHLEVR